eukprot:gene3134-4270_t
MKIQLLQVLIGVVVSVLCVSYTVLVYNVLQPADFSKFRTLDGITSLTSAPGAALIGWIHYLAFDLMTGLFIANNATKHGIPYPWIVPCLILTFMLGPNQMIKSDFLTGPATSISPIGIFDSGYGGLTVFKEIAARLPGYDYIYLGDNARAPYGSRSFETIYQYTLQAVNWFFEMGCPLVIL